MRIILFGPPGVGKGSLADMLTKEYGIVHISSGNLIRALVSTEERYNEYRELVAQGGLLPDHVVIEIISRRLLLDDVHYGYILDGFPRTLGQTEFLEKALREQKQGIDIVFSLEASDDLIVKRLSGRRVCPACQAIYHMEYFPPKESGICDRCCASLMQREDDMPACIRKRLKLYLATSLPLIEYYAKKKILHAINTDRPLSDIFSDILKIRQEQLIPHKNACGIFVHQKDALGN
ncbi:TPA: nucleoside monophosphate kinase [Candidatus Woesearchaeota archaeon]|nr:nucleoside monophosphate kinase [Candidatus Woesearchaeota archaeon]HII69436.1 nucleoside monophosphate kinase [Candidatus Woesearchaeota archaeon]